MVWAAIGKNGKLQLQFVESKMNASKYQAMLQDVHLKDERRQICGEEWIFMQDNAPIHTAKTTIKFFEDQGIKLLDWPACSPDLNPIENC